MLKILGVNLIVDAIVLFIIFYDIFGINDDGDIPIKALFITWLIWVIFFAFITFGICLLFL